MLCSPRGGSVRCLGWENLDRPLEHVSKAITFSLRAMGVPFDTVATTRELPSAFVATPAQPCSEPLQFPMDMDDDVRDDLMMPASPALRVCIHIVEAEAVSQENVDKHHVRLRRTQGSHWRLQAFYKSFRSHMCQQLGLPDEKTLSLYSPMTPKRSLDVANLQPLSAWSKEALEPQHDRSPAAATSTIMRRPSKMPFSMPAPGGRRMPFDASS